LKNTSTATDRGWELDRAAARGQCFAAMTDPALDITKLTFEDALRALEDVVRKLESGEVPLDDSISLYERGEALRKHCQARLDAASARIDKIVAGPNGTVAGIQPFDDQDR
jgi:exodeoxyribonuclease VII small subunit